MTKTEVDVARVLSAAGWDSRFRPSEAAFEEWRAALSPGRTALPTTTGLLFLGLIALWPNGSPWMLVTVFLIGAVVVFWLLIRNQRARSRAEQRLIEEYRSWNRGNGDRL